MSRKETLTFIAESKDNRRERYLTQIHNNQLRRNFTEYDVHQITYQ